MMCIQRFLRASSEDNLSARAFLSAKKKSLPQLSYCCFAREEVKCARIHYSKLLQKKIAAPMMDLYLELSVEMSADE